jgi:hypothetical protein
MAVLAGLVVLASVVAGCSGDDGGSASDAGRRGQADETSAPTTPPPPAQGIQLEGRSLGVKYALVAVDKYAAYLERLRGTPTFHEAVWCDVERQQGARDWSELDRAMAVALQYDIDLMLKIRVGSCWATGGQIGTPRGEREKTASTTPEDLALYDDWVTALVERYGPQGVTRWAVENEVNTTSFWVGSAEEYGALAERSAAVVRAAQPDAVIYDSGLSSLTFGVATVLDLLEQGRADDALAVYERYFERRHSTRARDYPAISSVDQLQEVAESERWATSKTFIDETFRLVDAGVVDRLQVHFYETWHSVPDLMTYLREQLPAGVPAEVWEAGLFWPEAPDDPDLIGEETIKTVSLLYVGGASSVLWLPLGADPNEQGNEENRFGVLDPDGTPRPVAEMFATLVAALEDAEVRPIAADGMAGLVATNDAGSTVVVWSNGPDVTLPVALPADATLVRIDGTTSTGAGASPEIGSEPVLIELPGSDAEALSELS